MPRPLDAPKDLLDRRGRWSAAVPGLVVAAVLAWAYRDVLFGGHALFFSDASLVHWPVRQHFVDRLLSGELPEWYPFDGLGTSYVGTAATGLLHPFVGLHLVLPHGLALSLGVVLAHAFAAAGTFRLLRFWGSGRPAALVGAVAFMACGYLMSMDGRPAYLYAAAFVPWAVLGLESASPALCSASMALVALSGERLHTLVFASLLLLVLALGHAERRRALKTLAAGGLVALLASAAQWLPALRSFDAAGAPSGPEALAAARLWSFNPARLFEFLTPGFVRLPGGAAPVHLYSQPEFGSFWADSVFLGAAVLALAFVALRSAPGRGPRAVLAGFAALALLVALGQGARAPVFEALQRVAPGFTLLRYPERTLLFVAWPLACLAGLGTEAVLSDPTRARAAPLLARTLAALLGVQVLLLLALPWLESAVLAAAGADSGAARDEFRGLVPSFRAGLLSGAVLTALSLALVAAMGLRGGGLRAPLLVASAVVPLLVAAEPFRAWRADPSQVLPRRGAAGEIARAVEGPGYGRSRVYAYYSAVQPRCASGPLCADVPLSYRTLPFLDLENPLGYLPMTSTGRPVLAETRLPSTVYFRGFNVGFAVPPDARAASRANASGLLEDPGAGERIRLVRGIPVATLDGALAVAGAPGFDAVRSVPVETTAPDFPATAPSHPTILVHRYAPEGIDLEASSDTPCTLFVADAYAPGWTATLDGRAAEILPGLVAGRAMALPAGRHRVQMVYRTPGLRVGLALSALGWALVVALAVLRRRGSGGLIPTAPSRAPTAPGGPASG